MTAQEIIENGLYNVAVEMMDDEIRESIHSDIAPCTQEEFLEEYMRRHFEKYSESFTI